MPRFEQGDKVHVVFPTVGKKGYRLASTLNAPKGAIAIVGPKGMYGDYVDIIWIEGPHNQANGGYYPEHFELMSEEKLPDWIKIEPERIIPAKKTIVGYLVQEANHTRPGLKVCQLHSKAIALTSSLGNSSFGSFTKKGLQEWIKALQELESHMDE